MSSTRMVEPPEADREYYRSRDTGVRGYLVKDENSGKPYMRVERGAGHMFDKLYHEDQWSLERDFAPLSEYDLARIRYEADAALAFTQRDYKRSRKVWQHLPAKQRRAWVDNDPTDELRKALSVAIRGAMERFMKHDIAK